MKHVPFWGRESSWGKLFCALPRNTKTHDLCEEQLTQLLCVERVKFWDVFEDKSAYSIAWGIFCLYMIDLSSESWRNPIFSWWYESFHNTYRWITLHFLDICSIQSWQRCWQSSYCRENKYLNFYIQLLVYSRVHQNWMSKSKRTYKHGQRDRFEQIMAWAFSNSDPTRKAGILALLGPSNCHILSFFLFFFPFTCSLQKPLSSSRESPHCTHR